MENKKMYGCPEITVISLKATDVVCASADPIAPDVEWEEEA